MSKNLHESYSREPQTESGSELYEVQAVNPSWRGWVHDDSKEYLCLECRDYKGTLSGLRAHITNSDSHGSWQEYTNRVAIPEEELERLRQPLSDSKVESITEKLRIQCNVQTAESADNPTGDCNE